MKAIKRWLSAHPSLAFALSGGVAAAGVAASCPASGFWATLPVGFLLFNLSALLCRSALFPPLFAVLAALVYGFGVQTASPLLFALAVLLSALAAEGIALCVKKTAGKKRLLLLVAPTLLGVLLPMLFYGTPVSYHNALRDARAYLARRYPDQAFEQVKGSRDPGAAWRCECTYLYEGNPCTSVILFGKTVDDGFLRDRMEKAQETCRSRLIEALRDSEEGVLVEPAGVSEALLERDVVPGVIGSYDPALEGEMDFTLTFRREKTQKRAVALSVKYVTELLREKGLTYHTLRFVAVSAGEPVYACTVTPSTAPEELMDLVTRL